MLKELPKRRLIRIKANGWRVYSYMGVYYRARGEQSDYLDYDGKWLPSSLPRTDLFLRIAREH